MNPPVFHPSDRDVDADPTAGWLAVQRLTAHAVRGVPLAGAALGLGELVGGHQARKGVATPDSYPPVFTDESRRREVAPHMGLYVVLRDTATGAVHEAEVRHRVGVSLRGRRSIPADGLGIVLRHTATGDIHVPEVVLRRGDPLRGRQSIPADGLGVVLRHTATAGVHDAEVGQRPGVSLPGRQSEPADGLGVVLRDTATVGVQEPEVELRVGVALRGRQSIPADGFGSILRHTATGVVHDPKVELRVGVALLSARSEFGHLCGCLPMHQSTRRQRDQDGEAGDGAGARAVIGNSAATRSGDPEGHPPRVFSCPERHRRVGPARITPMGPTQRRRS